MNRKINSIPIVRIKTGEQDRRTIMEKHIMGENGISYTLGEDGLYYPDLYLPEETEYPIGKYGMLRKTYLKDHRKGLYLELVLAGKLNEPLHQTDEECNQIYNLSELYPKKDTILFSKDGSVGIAYKMEKDDNIVTSGALLHLNVINTLEVLPDYLTLVLNSSIVQMQAERDTNGAIIQHWKPSDIEKVVIPIIDMEQQEKIAIKIKESFSLRKKSNELLDWAKRAVEIAIEQNEGVALQWLKEKGIEE